MVQMPAALVTVWPTRIGVVVPVAVAKSCTIELGSEKPKKFGWVTLVMSSVFDTPLSLAGLSTPMILNATSLIWMLVATLAEAPPTSWIETTIGKVLDV